MKCLRILYMFLVLFIIISMNVCTFLLQEKHVNKLENEAVFTPEIKAGAIDDTVLSRSEVTEESKIKSDLCEVFFDDFDGDEIDENFWNRMDREKNYNRELQAYVSENAFVYDGNLVLLAQEIDRKYISGLVDTKSKLEFKYGIVEVKLKHPEGKSFFPAVWMLPIDDSPLPEIDIFEVVGHEPDKIYTVYHYNGDEKQKIYSVTTIEDHLDYHTYKFEWNPYEMIWYIDDEIVFSTKEEIPNEPMYLILNFAIGGIWPGDPDENTIFPSSVLVDYIRVIPYETFKVRGEAR